MVVAEGRFPWQSGIRLLYQNNTYVVAWESFSQTHLTTQPIRAWNIHTEDKRGGENNMANWSHRNWLSCRNVATNAGQTDKWLQYQVEVSRVFHPSSFPPAPCFKRLRWKSDWPVQHGARCIRVYDKVKHSRLPLGCYVMLTGNVYRRCVGTCLDVQGHRCGMFKSRRLSGWLWKTAGKMLLLLSKYFMLA
jgi:hypothetical protein